MAHLARRFEKLRDHQASERIGHPHGLVELECGVASHPSALSELNLWESYVQCTVHPKAHSFYGSSLVLLGFNLKLSMRKWFYTLIKVFRITHIIIYAISTLQTHSIIFLRSIWCVTQIWIYFIFLEKETKEPSLKSHTTLPLRTFPKKSKLYMWNL